MTDARVEWVANLLRRHPWAVRLLAIEGLLLGAAWLVISIADTALGNVLFAMLVVFAGLLGLVVVGAAITSVLRRPASW